MTEAESTLHDSISSIPLPDGEPSTAVAAATSSRRHEHEDTEAQASVIESLRSQIQDLFSQVTQLNSKLVQSYDRVSDLEDNLHITSSNLRSSTVKISELELERSQYQAALNTGLLVEKSHVTAELTRLMEKATEEAAQRGQAESARQDIEKELDDLSANLFDQANTMVAEARLSQARSERKVEEAELALRGAEEAVGLMQQQMQALQEEKQTAESEADRMRTLVGKGKWVDKTESSDEEPSRTLRLRKSHPPYQEFLLFVAHLRSVCPTLLQPPAMSTLLTLPFVARLLTEDSEPTVRLDLAPSLNWLSRRAVLAAIHNGQLSVEPMPTSSLLAEIYANSYSTPSLSGISPNPNPPCALCGLPIFPIPASDQPPRHPHPMMRLASASHASAGSMSWLRLPRSRTTSAQNSPPTTPPPHQSLHDSSVDSSRPQHVYVFRLASANSNAVSGPTSLSSGPHTSIAGGPSSSQLTMPSSPRSQSQARTHSTVYPLCSSGWCLTRLRTTCSLWAFVRGTVVEKIYEECSSNPLVSAPGPIKPNGRENAISAEAPPAAVEKAQPQQKKRSIWGMASVFTEKASSWVGESEKERPTEEVDAAAVEKAQKPAISRRLPPPPPVHPSRKDSLDSTALVHRNPPPPPLPQRSNTRKIPPVPDRASTPAQNGMQDEKHVENGERHTNGVALADETDEGEAGHANSVGSHDAVESEPDHPAKSDVDASDEHKSDKSRPHISTESVSAEATGSTQDLFETPTEEIGETIPDPISPAKALSDGHAHADPASIPLPRSPLPVIPASFAEQQASHAAAEPIANRRPGRPAGGRALPPPAGSSVTPPPLPRRAANRRPMSIPQSVPSPAASPAPVDSANYMESETHATNGGADVVLSDGLAHEPLARSAEDAESSDVPGETMDATDALAPSPTIVSKDTSESDEKMPEDLLAVDEEAQNHSASPVDIDSPTSTAKQSTFTELPPVNRDLDKRTVTKSHVNGTSSMDGKESYVGDATWEERSWKEVVRLKEDMFWARIGAFR